jgi:hypothetical protein
MRIRGGLITAIYEKALVLSNDERRNRQTGDIVNLMSIDATRMQDLCTYGLMTISGPFQVYCLLLVQHTRKFQSSFYLIDHPSSCLSVQSHWCCDLCWRLSDCAYHSRDHLTCE